MTASSNLLVEGRRGLCLAALIATACGNIVGIGDLESGGQRSNSSGVKGTAGQAGVVLPGGTAGQGVTKGQTGGAGAGGQGYSGGGASHAGAAGAGGGIGPGGNATVGGADNLGGVGGVGDSMGPGGNAPVGGADNSGGTAGWFGSIGGTNPLGGGMTGGTSAGELSVAGGISAAGTSTSGAAGAAGAAGGYVGGHSGAGGAKLVFDLAEDLISIKSGDTSQSPWRLASASRVPQRTDAALESLMQKDLLAYFWTCSTCAGILNWSPRSDLVSPLVAVNTSDTVYTNGSARVPPHVATGHPGAGGEYADFVWIAPQSGTADIVARFTGVDATTSDGCILVRGRAVFSASINGYLASTFYSSPAPFLVEAGDTVEFAIGPGTNDNRSDTTQLDAQVQFVAR